MDKSKHLIIGAGPAALAAAQAIRAADKNAEIKLVSREETLPYSPAVLPYLISQEINEKDFFGKGKDVLAESKVILAMGQEVVEILHETKEVKYKTGETEAYDKLLIATGASPMVPEIDNLDADQVYTFRTFADFERLNKTLTKKQKIAINGAGLVAVEVAEKLSLAGHDVTIIARSSLLRKYFSANSVAILENAFKQHGTTILTKTTLESVNKVADQLELKLSNGEKLRVDRLIIATGVAPNRVKNELLPSVDGAYRVTKRMETEVPNIYAAGDIAAPPSFYDGQNSTCPILPEAVFQGKIAGMNMAGGNAEYTGWIGCNYLRCFDENLFSIGVTSVQPELSDFAVEKEAGNSFLKLLFKGEYLVGAEGFNMKSVHPGILLYLIREQVPVLEYRELLLDKPREMASWLMLQHRKNQTV